MELILDTNFIITAEREAKRGERDRADRFLEKHASDRLLITFTVAGELACGRSAAPRRAWEKLCKPYPVIPWSKEICWMYGEVYRDLAGRGELIGANDMWIAATALAHQMPVVTNNLDEFRRVAGLEVIAY